MVNYSNSNKDFEIPVDIIEKWQRIVNIMSKLLHVPTGFIMKVNAPNIQIFTSNVADTNPYHAGQNFELTGLYCEKVMKSDNLLCVPDALKDPEWDNNPEIPAGFIYYLGYPIHQPNGKMFGTICVQDYENNSYATDNKDLLEEFRSVCEIDLLMIHMRMDLESIVAERTVDLRKSEEKYRNLIEQANDGIVVLQEGRIGFVNSMMEKMFGYTSKEFLNAPFEKFVPAEEVPKVADIYKRRMNNENVPSINESYILHKDGSRLEVEFNAKLSEYRGKPADLVIVRDITERKKTELALIESESKLREAQKISKIGIWEWDLAAHKGYYSEETYKIFDIDPDPDTKIVADKMIEIIHPEDRERHDYITRNLFNKEVSNEAYDYRIIHRDGTIRYVYTEAYIKYDADGNPLTIGGIVKDITEHKQAEQTRLREAEFKQLVSQLSTKFTGLSGVKFENAIENSFQEIGKYFKVDTVRLYRLSLQGDVVKIRNMWRSETLAPPEEMSEIHKLKYPNLAAHYSKGKSIVFSKFDDSPPWPEMRKILKFFGTKAGVGVPLEVDSSGVDVFAMDKVVSEDDWSNDIIVQAKTIGMFILSARHRREDEVKLQDSYDEIKRLKEHLEQENIYLQEEIKVSQNFDTIIGKSTALKYVLRRLEQVAPTDTTVCIMGETGTGKELFAHALHKISLRKDKPMIKVGCATLPSNLIESELFGHEKGAFTGADNTRIGRFELANDATIFLDEIGELSLGLQAKLLRVLQEGEFERLGSSKTKKLDVRVIAATNRNLEEEVKQGRFREDLYYRLTAFIITIPPLRERREDIPLLVKFLVDKFSKKLRKKIKSITRSSMRNMENYSWSGNIRELENVIENAIIISEKEILKVEILGTSGLPSKSHKKLEDIEKDHIIKALESTNWRLGGKSGAAEILGLKRTTLYAKMNKYGIKRLT